MFQFYLEVGRTAFRRQLIYRWANVAGLLTNIFFASIFSFVIIGLYHARPSVSGYNVQDALRYTWIVQAMVMSIIPFSWNELMLTIRTGEVVTDLSKPCDFYGYWFSREMGRNLYYLLFRGVPIYLAGMFLFGIGFPLTWSGTIPYLLAFLFGATIGIAYRYLYNILAFWLVEARALSTFAVVISQFFTGSYVPIPLFPGWLRAITEWLPFNGLMNVPTQIFLDKLYGLPLWFEIARQFVWLIIITLVVRTITRIATRRVIAQGG